LVFTRCEPLPFSCAFPFLWTVSYICCQVPTRFLCISPFPSVLPVRFFFFEATARYSVPSGTWISPLPLRPSPVSVFPLLIDENFPLPLGMERRFENANTLKGVFFSSSRNCSSCLCPLWISFSAFIYSGSSGLSLRRGRFCERRSVERWRFRRFLAFFTAPPPCEDPFVDPSSLRRVLLFPQDLERSGSKLRHLRTPLRLRRLIAE